MAFKRQHAPRCSEPTDMVEHRIHNIFSFGQIQNELIGVLDNRLCLDTIALNVLIFLQPFNCGNSMSLCDIRSTIDVVVSCARRNFSARMLSHLQHQL